MEPEDRNSPSGFAIDRETVTLGSVVSAASDAWRRDVGTWALATVLFIVIGWGIPKLLELVLGIALGAPGGEHSASQALVDGFDFGLAVLGSLLNGILTMGIWAMAYAGLHGRPAPIGALFSQVRKVLKYILQRIAIWVPLGLILGIVWASVGTVDLDMPLEEAWDLVGPPLAWFALCIAPVLLYVFLGVVFAVNELTLDDRVGPVEAIVRSWRIARGKRWLILGTLIVSTVISAGSFLLCGVGILFGGPFATLLVGGLYLALRRGTDVPVPDTHSTLGAP